MLNIKNKLSFAAVICVVFIIFAAASQNASAQKPPEGSYRKSCYEAKVVKGSILVAKCVTKDEHMKDARLDNYKECGSDISNQNGVLYCQMTVYVNTDGNSTNTGTGTSTGNKNSAPPPPPPTETTDHAIERAFHDVYGYPAPADRFAYWQSHAGNYTSIVAAESKRQNAEPIARKLMISRVYKDTMGRNATKTEMDYWVPKSDYYKQIFDASRAYLYAPNGSTDLLETVKRALTLKNGKNPLDEEVKQAITKYRMTKAIYDEMN